MAVAGALAASTPNHAEGQASGAASLRVALYLPGVPGRPPSSVGLYDRAALRGLDLWGSGAGRADVGGMKHRRVPVLTVAGGDGGHAAIRAWYAQAAGEHDALVAPYGSAATAAAFEAAEAAGIPCLAPSAGSAELWSTPRRWCVGLLEPTPTFFHGALRWLAASRPGGLALVHRDDAFSTAVMDGADLEARRLGFAPVRRRAYASDAERDGAAHATREPAVLGIGWTPGGAGDGFLDDALALACALPREPGRVMVLGVGGADPDFARTLGPLADGVVGVTGWRAYLETEGNRAFVAAYRLRWGCEPDAHAAQAFAAGQVLEQAARLARQGRGSLRESLRAALHALDVETVFGRYRVNVRGMQVGHEPTLVRWQNGQAVVLDVPPPTTS